MVFPGQGGNFTGEVNLHLRLPLPGEFKLRPGGVRGNTDVRRTDGASRGEICKIEVFGRQLRQRPQSPGRIHRRLVPCQQNLIGGNGRQVGTEHIEKVSRHADNGTVIE